MKGLSVRITSRSLSNDAPLALAAIEKGVDQWGHRHGLPPDVVTYLVPAGMGEEFHHAVERGEFRGRPISSSEVL